jgi:hypothetical protein
VLRWVTPDRSTRSIPRWDFMASLTRTVANLLDYCIS